MVSGLCWDCGCRLPKSTWGFCSVCKAVARSIPKRRKRPIRTPEETAARRERLEWRQQNLPMSQTGFAKANFLNRVAALSHYSEGSFECRWCKIADIDVLCLDHIDGNGAEHRLGLGNQSIWKWLKDNGYPDGFQVLCRNCNQKKALVERQYAGA